VLRGQRSSAHGKHKVSLLTLAQLAAGLRAKEFSSVELTRLYLERIEAQSVVAERLYQRNALAGARGCPQADRARGRRGGALTGVPIAHKDIFCTKGVRTTCGSRMLDNFVSPYDATVVAKLRAAGVVMLGKTNMDEFAMGSSNETSYYGAGAQSLEPGARARVAPRAARPRRSPRVWRLSRPRPTPAARSASPPRCAAVTGLEADVRACVALRHGRLRLEPRPGGVLIDQYRRMQRWVLREMAGFDPTTPPASISRCRTTSPHSDAPLKGTEDRAAEGVLRQGAGPGERAAYPRGAAGVYESLGARLVEVSLPHLPLSVPVYYVVAPAECSSNLARFDGVRFGHRCENPRDLNDMYRRSRGEGFGAEVKRRIMTGTYVLSAGYYDAYYLKAQRVRSLINADFSRAFESVDVLLGPTTPTPAFAIGAKTADPITMYLNDIYTIGANLAGLPAISVPCGFVQDLPVGLQIVGPHFSEARVLNAAHAFQEATDWHTRAPAGYA
jgi:aspartyl-tRNA(Asn)/glutamyl-tRNA(Gln) amidotransferase subunit A